VVPCWIHGGTVVLQSGFEPERFLTAIEEHHITTTFAVPSMVYTLLDDPAVGRHDTSSLTNVVYGAAPMSPARLAEAYERFGPVFVQLYGQAEAPACVTALRKEDHDPARPELLASCGQVLPGVTVELHDDDDHEVPLGEVGEICVRSPLVAEGYWKRPELTAETFRNDWLHTGDLARADEAGFLSIVDRKKDMIITGGMNVFPTEIEQVLTAHDAVARAAVLGAPDDRWGESVLALVVLRPGQTVSPEELQALVRERKGPVFTPKVVEFVDSIPLTPIGKPDKKALRARYWAGQSRQVH
jgi:fatty-acyl-CoA synthase